MSAYDHSFLPSATGSYILQLFEAGWTYDAARTQAAIEHGDEQVVEIDALARQAVAEHGWSTCPVGSRPALLLAIRRAQTIEAERQL
jgi:hypothetical protein